MKNIALVGPMYSGKDTLASCFIEKYSYQRVSFGDAVKREVIKALNSSNQTRQWHLQDIENDKPRFRALLQWWGTEYRRREDPDYWVKKLWPFLQIGNRSNTLQICTDARFLNEIKILREYDFSIVQIQPDEALLLANYAARGVDYSEAAVALSHVSEQEWQSVAPDLVVRNILDRPVDLLVEQILDYLK